MAGTRQILQRRRAAENINKITHTMETVSSVRYRRYYRMWLEGIDFYDALAQLAYLVITAQESIAHPLMTENDSPVNAILVMGSNRGLCGAYNGNLCRLAEVHIKMAKRFERELKVYVHGRKISNHLSQRGITIEHEYEDFEEIPSVDRLKEIADDFTRQYISGAIGRFGIVYTRFYSPASQHAQTLSIFPFADLIDDLATRATVIWPWELAYEDFLLSPSAEEIFDGLATMITHTSVAGCFTEAALSEHLGRVVAMRNATDNAGEMIDDLTRQYNRARQSQITGDLLDIIGGILAATK